MAEGEGRITVRVDFQFPDNMPLLSADLASCQALPDKGIFHLSFFQSQLPMVLSESDPPTSVTAQCVARLAITPPVMQSIIDLLQTNFGKFVARLTQEELREPAPRSLPGRRRPRGHGKS
ncbi:MAG: hypothetical protein HYR72_21795 [Deltaproteobacteria bacterium]|nr:hypothetical protein [Deltaproteobacteria bacterium]MBI3390152.1 hypothetical protein [Deltaproteobacteria bacterium]